MNLRELREYKGLSAIEIGRKMGMTRQSVYLWEKGEHLPSLNKLPLLERAYGKKFIKCLIVTLKENGKWNNVK